MVECVEFAFQPVTFHRSYVGRTFRHDDDVGTVKTGYLFAQSAFGQQMVVGDETVVVDEQDVDVGMYIAVLESIVKQNDIDRRLY